MWKKLALGTVGLIAVAIVGTVVFFHTAYGRDVLKRQIEQRIAAAVTGKVTIGALEGTPFSTLVLRDLRIDDADGHPALQIETLSADLAILPLFGKRLHFDHVVADGVTLATARGHGVQLVAKRKPSAWALEFPDIAIARGAITGEVALDGIVLHGRFARGPNTPMHADLAAYGTLRDRGPVFAAVALRMDRENQLQIPAAFATFGGAVIAASGVAVGAQTGVVLLDAPRGFAGIDLRDRVTVLAAVSPGWLVDAAGMYGASPVRAVARLDLAARRVRGMVVASGVAVPRGRAGGIATFDLAPGGELPIGTAFATVWTELAGLPPAQLGLAIESDGATAGVALDGAAQGTRVTAGGVVSRIDKQLALAGGRLRATSTDLAGGTTRADLRGSGALWPYPDLALAGSLDAVALHERGVSATGVHLALDAQHLPARPAGTADLRIASLARGATELGALALSVRTRGDGKLAVVVDSRRDAAAWLLHGDALVAVGPTIDIALGHHAVRAGGAATWAGDGGRITISPARIAIAGLRSASADGSFALDAALQRHTREATVALTAASSYVDALALSAAFAVPADARRPAAWRAAVHSLDAKATGIHADAALFSRLGIASNLGATVDVAVHGAGGAATIAAAVHHLHGAPLARPIDLRIDATTDAHETRGAIGIRGPGQVNLGDLAIAIPGAIEGIRRTSPITGTVTLTTAPAPMFAMLAGRDQLTGGLISGTVAVAGTLATPELTANLVATQLAVAAPRTQSLDRLVVRGTYRGGALDAGIESAERGGTLRLGVRGRPDAPDDLAFSLVATHFDLAPILALVPGRAAGGAGRIEANLGMHGLDPRTARFSGELHVTGGRVPLSPSIGTLRDARFDATIANDTLHLVLASKLGGGALTASGTISLAEHATDFGRVDIRLRKVSPIGVLQPVIDADLAAHVHREARRVIADVVVDNGNAVVPRRRGVPLAPIGGPDEMRLVGGARVLPHAKAKQLPEDPTMVANIIIHPLRIDDELIRGVVIGRLTMSNARDAFGIAGTITAVHGDFDLMGRRYLVDHGTLRFDGGTDPLLDIAISHTDADVRTAATIRGRLSGPVVAMAARPDVTTQGELVGSLLAPVGDPRDVAERDRATAAGETTIASEVGARIRGNLPLNVLRYESATAANSAAVTAGSWLSHALFLAYRRHLEARPDENVGEGDLEYWLGQRLSLDGTLGDRGYHGIDLLWRRRY